jgi:heterodisulfide reductase subunit A-like polyferredoxin/coenzyme F420-reducing hydrogenase delta subunit
MSKTVSKIAVLIWDQGERLARALDLEALLQKLSKAKGVVRGEVIGEPWSAACLSSLKEDLATGRIDRILWVGRFAPEQVKNLQGALSQAGLNPFLHQWCDLKEQGILQEGVDGGVRNRKALALLEMALARTRLLEPLEPLELPATDALLIIGAGVAGIHTALSLAELGKRVYLVEKESGVGGKVALLSRFYPRLCDPQCGLQHAVERLAASDLVEFHTLATMTSLEGSPGNFTARIQRRPRCIREERCNGCGVCTAGCPVEVPGVPAGHGLSPQGLAFRPPARKAVHPAFPMAFSPAYVIDREYCPSGCRVCEQACPTQAIELDQAPEEKVLNVGAVLVTTGWDPYPLARVSEFGYGRHARMISNLEMERLLSPDFQGQGFSLSQLDEVGFIQCVGSRDERHLRYCSGVCCSATLKQALAFKEQAPAANCYVFFMDLRATGFNEELYLRARDLGVIFIRERPTSVKVEEASGRLNIRVNDPILGRPVSMDLDLLVLAGGMAPAQGTPDLAQILNLPQNQYGFFESHHQCHPEESQRTGIYVGGCAREPMNVSQSIESAHLAAMKALKFLEGPVLINPTYPVVDKTRCDQCKRCVEECPFSSFGFDEKSFPTPDLARCRQCGNCMGICPLGVISLQHHTIKQTAAQVEAVNTGFMGDHEPVILAFLCENDAYPAARSAVELGLVVPPNVIFIKVPCAGAVNNALVADALSFGIDGVLIAGCQDDQCHYVRGSQLVKKRSGDLAEKLRTMMIEPERVRFESLEIRQSQKYVNLLQAYIEDLKAMGPNPFKI